MFSTKKKLSNTAPTLMNRAVVVNSDVEYSASANLNEHTLAHATGLRNYTAIIQERTETFASAHADSHVHTLVFRWSI